jgi:hypothetical protein
MATGKTYYLSRDGKSFGPYTEEEYEQIKHSVEYSNYSWVWSSDKPGWEPVIPPPPPPPKEQKELRREGKRETEIQAICHNNQVIMNGWIVSVDGSKFTFICEKSREGFPTFGDGNKVILNLLSEHSGKSENAVAKVIEVHRNRGRWEYAMEWDKIPQIMTMKIV